MDRSGREAALDELVRDLRGRALGAREDDRQAAPAGLQHAGQQLDLVQRVRAVDDLLDVLDRLAVVVRRGGADVRRLRHVATGHRDDRARHGRREQHRVAARRRRREQRLDVGQEAEVEHLVRLVQHDRPDVREVEVALLEHVDHAARRADDDVDALLQRLDLRLVRAPAVDLHDADGAARGGGREVARDLHRQLARRDDDEGLRLARSGQPVVPVLAGGDDAVEQRDAEAQRLAGARLGLADDVVAGQRDGERHRLDGERLRDAGVGERLDDLRPDVEVGERRVDGLHGRRGAAQGARHRRGERGRGALGGGGGGAVELVDELVLGRGHG